jgi:hypothetical protein
VTDEEADENGDREDREYGDRFGSEDPRDRFDHDTDSLDDASSVEESPLDADPADVFGRSSRESNRDSTGDSDETDAVDDPWIDDDESIDDGEPIDGGTSSPWSWATPTDETAESSQPDTGEQPSKTDASDRSRRQSAERTFDDADFEPDPDVDREAKPVDGRDDRPRAGRTSGSDDALGEGVPLEDLAERMREQRDRGDEDLDDVDDDLFEEVEVGRIDQETLWQQVTADEGFVVEPPSDREDVIEKATYCEKCEFFTEPPTARCTHEGTAILELVDLEHFRVRNCPIVLEEEALENIND